MAALVLLVVAVLGLAAIVLHSPVARAGGSKEDRQSRRRCGRVIVASLCLATRSAKIFFASGIALIPSQAISRHLKARLGS
jgi:hypothetical protein